MLFLVCLCSSVFICHNQWSLFINKRLSLCLFINSHKLQPLMEFCIHNKIRGWSLFNTDWYQGSKHNIKIISSFFKQFLGMGKILSFPLSHFFFPLSLSPSSQLYFTSLFFFHHSLSLSLLLSLCSSTLFFFFGVGGVGGKDCVLFLRLGFRVRV